MAGLFREEITSQRLTELGEPLGIVPGWLSTYTLVLLVVLVVGAVLITVGTYARKVRVSGFLFPDKGLIKILPSHAGYIVELRVVEGQHVAKDDVLAVIDVDTETADGHTGALITRNLRHRRDLIASELDRLSTIQSAERMRLDAAIDSLNAQVSAAEQQLASLAEVRELAVRSLERFKQLEKQAVYSLAQREKMNQDVANAAAQLASIKRSLATTKGDLAQAVAQRTGLEARQANDRAELGRTISDIDQQLLEREQQQRLVIRAAESGTATRLIGQPGAAVDTTSPIMTIVPDASRLQAYLYVPSNAAGFIKTGSRVLLRFDAFPYQKFGVQNAEVASISRTAVGVKELPFPPNWTIRCTWLRQI